MEWLNFLPLGLVVVAVLVLFSSQFNETIDRGLTKLALAVFGKYVQLRGTHPDRARLLKAAFVGRPYRNYAARALLFSTIAALAGSILGVYLGYAFLVSIPTAAEVAVQGLSIPPESVTALRTVPELSQSELFGLLLFSSATVGVVGWVVIYWLHWWLLDTVARSRRQAIELSIPRTIAFMYALSRGGLDLPRILQLLQQNQTIYGQAAAELSIASRAIHVFQNDTVTALHTVAKRTPSDPFRIFTENLASVLQSGRNLPEFLHDQYEQFQEENEGHQEAFLDRLGAIAEAYVALFVVGPLFLLTVLLIFGLISGETANSMRLIIYVFMPLMNLGFIYYLDVATQPYDVRQSEFEARAETIKERIRGSFHPEAQPTDGQVQADGGTADSLRSDQRRQFKQLARFDRLGSLRRTILQPVRQIKERPSLLLYATVPLGLVWLVGNAMVLDAQDALSLAAMDDVFVQASLLVVIPFAIARRRYTRHRRAIERVIPDLFNRLASLNEAGVEIVSSFKEIRRSDLGPLTPEIERIWTDIDFGNDVETALYRFELRIRSPSVSRSVTLITNGMKASGNIGKVLRIAADETRRRNTLKREREEEMSIYLIITYLSFLVFLVIVFVLVDTFIPAVPTQDSLDAAGLTGAAAGITQEQATTFTMLLYHASLVQAVFSGLIAGQMSHGSIRDGALHVAILLVVAYLLFAIVI